MASVEIKSYSALQYTNSNSPAMISLYDTHGHHFADVWFANPEGPIPASRLANGFYTLNYRDGTYPYIVDLLRNEKPCSMTWYPNSSTGVIYSGKEPVGEGEMPAPSS